eukprot:Amastigsp_a511980_6.p5 type:complete len:126 gc:universal Amastigsp_a511980_6:338-715(+)
MTIAPFASMAASGSDSSSRASAAASCCAIFCAIECCSGRCALAPSPRLAVPPAASFAFLHSAIPASKTSRHGAGDDCVAATADSSSVGSVVSSEGSGTQLIAVLATWGRAYAARPQSTGVSTSTT